MDKDNILKFIILFVVMIAVFIVIVLSSPKNETENKIELVDDYSMFFTVEDSVNRYIGYISDKENDKLLNVLNKKYIKENNIDKDNVLNILDNLNLRENINTFEAIKMYQKNINTNLKEYYVSGKILREDIDDRFFISNYYVIVHINKNTNTFDITPYDEISFKEVSNEK